MSPPAEASFVPAVEEGVNWDEHFLECRISSVIGLLPTSMQSKMGPFSQFRRSASLGNIRSSPELTDASAGSKIRPMTSNGTTTVPDSEFGAGKNKEEGSQPQSPDRAVVARRVSSKDMVTLSPASDIDWRLAHQGANLIGIAADENGEGNEAFQRKAYPDGLDYLLRSLPQDLDASESEQIKAALKAKLARRDGPRSRSGASTPDLETARPKSLVYRLVQLYVFYFILVIRFIMPYVVVIFKAAASVERKYKLSEAIIGHGLSCFNALGRHCARVTQLSLTANGGNMGRRVSSSFEWTVEEVTRGISDGVGQGLVDTRWIMDDRDRGAAGY